MSKENDRENIGPVVRGVAFDGGFDASMPSFNDAVALRVVRCGLQMFDAEEFRQFREQGAIELAASVRCNGRRDAKTGDPTVDQSARNGFGGDVADRDGFWPARKTVDGGEAIRETSAGRKRADQIDMNVAESFVGRRDVTNSGFVVPLDFASLAGDAFFDHLFTVFVD